MLIWSIISATIPNMRNFMRSFAAGFGVPMDWGPRSQSTTSAYALQTIGGSMFVSATGRSQPRSPHARLLEGAEIHGRGSQVQTLRPDAPVHEIFIGASNGDELPEHEPGVTESDTQELIIRKRTEWCVCHSDDG